MSNVWHGLGIVHFQIPESVIPRLVELTGNAISIYLLVLRDAQRTSKPVVVLTSKDIRIVGVSDRRLSDALKLLSKSGLVKITRTFGRDAAITFELLDPETGLIIPSLRDRRLDISTLTTGQRLDYALSRLSDHDTQQDDNGVVSTCPFHNGHTYDARHSKLSFNTRTGQWHCFYDQCEHHAGGHMIEFEQALAKLRGKTLNGTNAWERIVSAIRGMERDALLKKQSLKEGFKEIA